MNREFKRTIQLPSSGRETFFLWGPRQTGKSTLLKQKYPDAHWVDLLQADSFQKYLSNPERLREEHREDPFSFCVIDEVQKIPALLDEVHWLHENRGVHFALCGSSARKVRRGHANLLGGRALRYELHGLTSHELREDFDVVRILNHGYLPRMYISSRPQKLWEAYVGDYLKEEIAAEALTRNLPVFAQFLRTAAFSDTELVNFSTIARDIGTSSHTVQSYFEILEDTLLGRFLPAFQRRPKRRISKAPKFYFADVGITHFLARRGLVAPKSELFGKAFENWVFHELISYNAYRERFAELRYWRLSTGTEVDFVINDAECAIEVKATDRIRSDHTRGLEEFATEHGAIRQRIIVSLEARARQLDNGIRVLPVKRFLDELWSGQLF